MTDPPASSRPSHRSGLLAGAAMVAVVVLAAVLGPALAPYDPGQQRLEQPTKGVVRLLCEPADGLPSLIERREFKFRQS